MKEDIVYCVLGSIIATYIQKVGQMSSDNELINLSCQSMSHNFHAVFQ